jgi:hypothetical protein
VEGRELGYRFLLSRCEVVEGPSDTVVLDVHRGPAGQREGRKSASSEGSRSGRAGSAPSVDTPL